LIHRKMVHQKQVARQRWAELWECVLGPNLPSTSTHSDKDFKDRT
jgi:hypothetical protein